LDTDRHRSAVIGARDPNGDHDDHQRKYRGNHHERLPPALSRGERSKLDTAVGSVAPSRT
jgi:hypothetical protein